MEKNTKRKTSKHIGFLLFMLWFTSAALIFSVAAETSGTGSTGDNGFSWSWSTDNTNTGAAGAFNASLSGTTLTCTITANTSTYVEGTEGGCGSSGTPAVNAAATTTTATVTNNTGSTIQITGITSDTATVSGLAVDQMIENGSSFTVQVTANPASGTDSTSTTASGTAVITYRIVENIDVVFYGAANATFTYGDKTVSGADDSATIQQAPGSSLTLPEVTVTSGTFMGWRMADGSVKQAGDTATFNSNGAVYPVVLSGSEIAPYTVNGTTYYFWEDAAYAAGSSGTIILNQNYTLPNTLAANGVSPAGGKFVKVADGKVTYIVPYGVQFLIPYSDANIFRGVPNEWTLEDMSLTSNGFPDPPEDNIVSAKTYSSTACTEYRRLTLAEGTSITVNGGLEVSGQTHPLASGQWGNYAVLQMGNNTSITVGSSGALYAYGFIRGNGTVTVESSGVVYEHYDVADYPPGGAGGLDPMNTAGVFGMTNYTFNNIEVSTTYKAGAKMKAYLVMTGYNIGTNAFIREFIGSDDNAVFNLKSGTITKAYSGGRQNFTLAGDIEFNKLYININAYIVNYTVDSSQTSGLPISHNWDIRIKGGATATLKGSVLMYSGSTLTIENGGKLVIPADIKFSLLDSASDPSSVTTSSVLDLNGEIQVDGGFYNSYSGTSIPVIKSSGGTGKVTVNYVGTETTFNVRASGNETESVNITPAQLTNEFTDNGKLSAYTDTTATGTYNYHATHKRWVLGEHTVQVTYEGDGKTAYKAVQTCTCGFSESAEATIEVTTVEPSCTEPGSTTYTATFSVDWAQGSTVSEESQATGHSWKEATLTAPKTCTVCGATEGEKLAPVAQVGDIQYATLGEAYEAAAAGSTIVLLSTPTDSCRFAKSVTVDVANVPGFTVQTAEGWNRCAAGENKYLIYSGIEETDKNATLLLESMVHINIYFLPNGLEAVDLENNAGLLVWTDRETPYSDENLADFVIGNEHVTAQHGATANGSYYVVKTGGIVAKQLGDDFMLRIYVKLPDGSYIYSTPFKYGAKIYALNKLKSAESNDQLKTLMVAMLDYGTAAQMQFDYNTSDPANVVTAEDVAKYTDVSQETLQQTITENRKEFSEDMLETLTVADSAVIGNWTRNREVCPSAYASLILEGIITNNFSFKFTPEIMENAQTATFKFWNQEDYLKLLNDGTTFENSTPTETITMVLDSDGFYKAGYDKTAVKDLGVSFYVCAEIGIDDVVYRSGIISYSGHTFIKNNLNTTDADFLNLVQCLGIYSAAAKEFFANSV